MSNRTKMLLPALLGVVVVAVIVAVVAANRRGSDGQINVSAADPAVVAAAGADITRPMVAVDPERNRVYVTWTRVPNDTDAISYLAVSEDGGRTFREPMQLGLELGGKAEFWTVPRVADDGTVFVAWTHWQNDILIDPTDPFSTAAWNYVIRSTDGGLTFSDPVLVESERPVEAHYYMNMVVSPDGQDVSVAWFNYTATVPSASDGVGRDATTMWVSTSHDGGALFGGATMVSDGACVCCMEAGVSLEGHPAFVFRDWTEAGDFRNPAIVASTDAGDSWDAPVTIHDDNFALDVCPHVGFGAGTDQVGQVRVSWWTGTPGAAGYYYATSADGRTFSEPVLLAALEAIPHENDVALGIDADDVAWVATVNPGDGDDAIAQAAQSEIAIWAIGDAAAPVKAFEVAGVYPQMAGTDHGAVLVWWQGSQLMAQRLESR